jgi:hypothetical protein
LPDITFGFFVDIIDDAEDAKNSRGRFLNVLSHPDLRTLGLNNDELFIKYIGSITSRF